MRFQYEATFRIDIGDAIPGVGDLLDKVNTLASSMGCEEKLGVSGEIFSFTVTADRGLTEPEQYKMKRILESKVIETFPQYDIRLQSFSEKSGNAQQSVA